MYLLDLSSNRQSSNNTFCSYFPTLPNYYKINTRPNRYNKCQTRVEVMKIDQMKWIKVLERIYYLDLFKQTTQKIMGYLLPYPPPYLVLEFHQIINNMNFAALLIVLFRFNQSLFFMTSRILHLIQQEQCWLQKN